MQFGNIFRNVIKAKPSLAYDIGSDDAMDVRQPTIHELHDASPDVVVGDVADQLVDAGEDGREEGGELVLGQELDQA